MKNQALRLGCVIQFCISFRSRHTPSAPFRSFSRQARAEFLLQIVHATPVQLMSIRVLTDGQTFYKPFLGIILVCTQHCLLGVVQEPCVFFQLGEITGDTPIFNCKSLDILMLQKPKTCNDRYNKITTQHDKARQK